jgi:hypothetical protein
VISQSALDKEVYECSDCRIFDPDHQPSVAEKLNNGWDPIVWLIYNGMSLGVPGLKSIQLSSRIVACPRHEDMLIANGGWDGTGVRQNTTSTMSKE